MPSEINQGYEFYGSQYARFGTAVAAEIRREVYGVDIGQQGWRSMDEPFLRHSGLPVLASSVTD